MCLALTSVTPFQNISPGTIPAVWKIGALDAIAPSTINGYLNLMYALSCPP